jgi:hypothetical protein
MWLVFFDKFNVLNDLLLDDDQMFLGLNDSLDKNLSSLNALDLSDFDPQSDNSSVNDEFSSDDQFLSDDKNLSSDNSLDNSDLSNDFLDVLMSSVDLLV